MYIKTATRLLLTKKKLLNQVANNIATKENCSFKRAKRKILIDSYKFGATYPEYEMFNFYNRSEQSNINCIGYQLSFWNETIKLIKQVSNINPDIHIVCWDVAITQNDPVLI